MTMKKVVVLILLIMLGTLYFGTYLVMAREMGFVTHLVIRGMLRIVTPQVILEIISS